MLINLWINPLAVEIPAHLPNPTSTSRLMVAPSQPRVAMCATLIIRRMQWCVHKSDSKEGYSGYSDVCLEGE